MIKAKKATQGEMIRKIIIIIIAILVLFAVLLIWMRGDLPNWFEQIFPDFFSETQMVYHDSCPVKVANLVDGEEIHFCYGNNCEKQYYTGLDKTDLEIELVKSGWNPVIGQITAGTILFKREIMERGDLYWKYFSDIPVYRVLLNLHGAYLYNDRISICRDRVLEEETPANSTVVGFLRNGELYKKTDKKPNGGESAGITVADKIIFSGSTEIGKLALGNITIEPKYISSQPSSVKFAGFLSEINGGIILNGVIYRKA